MGSKSIAKFKVLGTLECWYEGTRVPLGGPLQQRMVVALLLETGRVLSTSRLVDAVWEDRPPATASHQIRKMAAHLRHRIPGGAELLQTESAGYRLVLATEQLDLSVFEVRLHRAQEAIAGGLHENAIQQLTAALDLWRGPSVVEASPALEPLTVKLTEQRLTAFETLMELRLERGDGADLVAELRQIVAEQPLREHTRGQLMQALYRSGRQVEALDEYTDLRKRLVEELGIEPGLELVRLHAEILNGSPKPTLPPPFSPPSAVAETPLVEPQTAPCSLPHDVPDFTGRQQELAALLELQVSQQPTKIICVEAMGGSGKTVLAVHAARSLAAAYPDGQLFIDLAGFTPGQEPLTPSAALNTFLLTLGVPSEAIPEELLDRIALWRVTTAKRKLLIVLDNVADARQVQQLLPASPESLVFITSRVRLFALDGARVLPLGLFSFEDGRDLLTRVLGKERVAAEPDAVKELVELCGRLPLALRICAGRLVDRPHWSLAHMTQRLRLESRRLRELRGGSRSVAASINLSYLAMEPKLQNAFRKLGLFPGQSFDAVAAAALFDLTPDEAEDLLEGLLEVHLLGSQGDDRYTLHDLVRSHALGLCETEEERAVGDRAMKRLLDHFYLAVTTASNLLYQGKPLLRREDAWQPKRPLKLADPDEALSWLHQEHGTLVAAVRMARVRGLHWHAVVLPYYLGEYLQVYGHHVEDQEIAEEGLAAAAELGDPELMRIATTTLAVTLWNLSRYQEGLAMAERAYTLARELGDQVGEASCLSRIGAFHNQLGNFTDGLRYLEQAQETQRSQGALREMANIAISISSATGYLGQYERSAASAREAIALYRQLGELQGETLGLLNVANAEVGFGRAREALGYLEQAWKLAKARRTRTYSAMVLVRLARVHLLLNRAEEAQRCAAEISGLLAPGITPSLSVSLHSALGLVRYRYGGDLAQVRIGLQEALGLAERMGLRLGQAESLQVLAQIEAALGTKEEARECRRRAEALFDAMGVPVGHVRIA
ncbi:AfsR/SARP family transcriptional regulator [Streptomyces umbrinus]